MRFLERVRAYLEWVLDPGDDFGPPRRPIDEHALRRSFVDHLRGAGPTYAPLVANTYREWMPKISSFASYLARLPSADAPTDAARAQQFATQVLDYAQMPVPMESTIDELEYERIVARFRLRDMEPYALENRMVTRHAGSRRAHLTAVGRILLSLRGKDAVRWLLTVETLQCHGVSDPWHLDAEILTRAMSDRGIRTYTDEEGEDRFPYDQPVLDRAAQLGALVAWVHAPGEEPYAYSVPAGMRDVVGAVLETGPWHAAVRALLDDERTAALPALASTSIAADATVEQARMITHEVRNALVPVRGNLDAALRATTGAASERLERARRGVVHVLDFVEQLVSTTELITEVATTWDIAEVVAEALDQIDGGDRVTVDPPDEALRLQAPRSRFVVALVNLIRNALHAAPAPASVRIVWFEHEGSVTITVDDGGPGVPEADRARIFDDGYTTRPGGSGFGLALVKRFVETTLQGKVWCEVSDLGGARFVILIPSEPQT